MNKQNRDRLIDTGNKLMAARWERGWGLHEKDERIKKYKLQVIKTVTGK